MCPKNRQTHGDAVFLFFIPNVAAPGSHPIQSRAVDLHACPSANETILLPGNRVPQRHADLHKRATGHHGTTDCTHLEVLLLGYQSKGKERHHPKGTWYVSLCPQC